MGRFEELVTGTVVYVPCGGETNFPPPFKVLSTGLIINPHESDYQRKTTRLNYIHKYRNPAYNT